MNSVRCPVCNARLTGEDCDDLTVGLREHLEREHNIQELCNSPTGGVPPSTVARSYEPPEEMEPYRETEMDRERLRRGSELREAELRDETGSWGPPAGEASLRAHGVGGWFRKTLGLGYGDRPDQGGEWARGGRYSGADVAPRHPAPEGSSVREEYGKERGRRRERVPGREPAGPSMGLAHGDHVDCPMCGMHLSGADEDELSVALREHMISMHEVAPLMTMRPRA
ncbi:hypothetical protein [Methanomassiliicoccus luminyensis]|uniref:hypothetical protein n=1 Tax=Methanomassiliicoccus luminyensis TaxID=1080712 RepID=UPI0003608E42|nr:hypothetical protein [Methanomassiliicoccus luminyensis]